MPPHTSAVPSHVLLLHFLTTARTRFILFMHLVPTVIKPGKEMPIFSFQRGGKQVTSQKHARVFGKRKEDIPVHGSASDRSSTPRIIYFNYKSRTTKKIKIKSISASFSTKISTWFRKQISQKLSRQRKLQVHCMSKLN